MGLLSLNKYLKLILLIFTKKYQPYIKVAHGKRIKKSAHYSISYFKFVRILDAIY